MAKRVGETFYNTGSLFTVINVTFSPDSAIPTFTVRRNFDNGIFTARTNNVGRFTRLRRVWDSAHADLDPNNAMQNLDAAYRRI